MECISMRKRANQFVTLEVPGLAERRPSLVHGDFIFVKLTSERDNNTTPVYQVWSSFGCMSHFHLVVLTSVIWINQIFS